MAPEIQRIVELQRLDSRIKELQEQIATLPRQLAQAEKTLEAHIRKLEIDRSALAANLKDRKKFEADIQVQEQKASKLKGQMNEARTNEQYWAFQHEIEYCQQAIRKAEDKILDLMAASEPLDQAVAIAEKALEEERRSVKAEQQRVRELTAQDQKEEAELKTQRKQMIESIQAPLYSAYERARKKWGGVAISDATNGRCSACHIILRPQYFQELRQTNSGMTCESCGRLLYYNPPVDVAGEMNCAPG